MPRVIATGGGIGNFCINGDAATQPHPYHAVNALRIPPPVAEVQPGQMLVLAVCSYTAHWDTASGNGYAFQGWGMGGEVAYDASNFPIPDASGTGIRPASTDPDGFQVLVQPVYNLPWVMWPYDWNTNPSVNGVGKWRIVLGSGDITFGSRHMMLAMITTSIGGSAEQVPPFQYGSVGNLGDTWWKWWLFDGMELSLSSVEDAWQSGPPHNIYRYQPYVSNPNGARNWGRTENQWLLNSVTDPDTPVLGTKLVYTPVLGPALDTTGDTNIKDEMGAFGIVGPIPCHDDTDPISSIQWSTGENPGYLAMAGLSTTPGFLGDGPPQVVLRGNFAVEPYGTPAWYMNRYATVYRWNAKGRLAAGQPTPVTLTPGAGGSQDPSWYSVRNLNSLPTPIAGWQASLGYHDLDGSADEVANFWGVTRWTRRSYLCRLFSFALGETMDWVPRPRPRTSVGILRVSGN